MNDQQKRVLIIGLFILFATGVFGTIPTPPPIDDHNDGQSDPRPTGEIIVLFVEETDGSDDNTDDQIAAMNSGRVRDYLTSHNYEWRKLDDDVFDGMEPIPDNLKKYHDVMQRPRDDLPWVYVSNGKAGVEGSFENEDTVMAVLEKWGGK